MDELRRLLLLGIMFFYFDCLVALENYACLHFLSSSIPIPLCYFVLLRIFASDVIIFCNPLAII